MLMHGKLVEPEIGHQFDKINPATLGGTADAPFGGYKQSGPSGRAGFEGLKSSRNQRLSAGRHCDRTFPMKEAR